MADYTLNRTGAQIDAIGEIQYTSSEVTSLANNTMTDLCSLTLSTGRWIVFGQGRINPGSTDLKYDLSLSTTSGDIAVGTAGGLMQMNVKASAGICTASISRIVNVTAASTTVYLVARQLSGETKSITSYNQIMNAIRIR